MSTRVRRVAVLMGGRSLEREISLRSGQRVTEALERKGYEVTQLDLTETLTEELMEGDFDAVYIALHGKYGEDGTIQELLDTLGIPYTGPPTYANILSFDKVLSKMMMQANGIPTPPFCSLSAEAFKEMGAADLLPKVIEKVGLPIVVKPSMQGSALGIRIAKSQDELANALISALSYGKKVVLEKYIEGTEIAVSILDDGTPVALPIVEIAPKSGFFNFRAMYSPGQTDYYVPARLDSETASHAIEVAIKTHKLLSCSKVSRVDMIVDKKEKVPYVLELNTCPGMTETSLLPMAAKAAGIEFDDLVEKILLMSIS